MAGQDLKRRGGKEMWFESDTEKVTMVLIM